MDGSSVSEALRDGPANPNRHPPRRAGAKGVALPGTLPERYEHFAYTPYGESWVAEDLNQQTTTMTHRFTGQELDGESGLYAFPARYYDPQTSRWLGADPAMGEYLPVAPTTEKAREHNKKLPGMGGVFSPVNLAVYHYAANNPLRYVDPTGRSNERDSFTIEYYEDTDAPIVVSIDGEDLVVGEDLDFGDQIPSDAEVTVPEGGYLEIANDQATYGFLEGADISVDGYKAAVAEWMASEEYADALRHQRTRGWVNLGLSGIQIIGGGVLTGISKGTMAKVGAGNFLMGFRRLGIAMADVTHPTLIEWDPAVMLLAGPMFYADWPSGGNTKR